MVSNINEPQTGQQNTTSTDAPDQHPRSKTWAGKASILLLLLFIAGLATAAKPQSLPEVAAPSAMINCIVMIPHHGFVATTKAHGQIFTGDIVSAGVPSGQPRESRLRLTAF